MMMMELIANHNRQIYFLEYFRAIFVGVLRRFDTIFTKPVSNRGSLQGVISFKMAIQMEKQLKFKTNINCNNCIRSVSGFLNEVGEIKRWEVDIANPEKILTVEGDDLTAEAVIEAVEEAGFDIEEVKG